MYVEVKSAGIILNPALKGTVLLRPIYYTRRSKIFSISKLPTIYIYIYHLRYSFRAKAMAESLFYT